MSRTAGVFFPFQIQLPHALGKGLGGDDDRLHRGKLALFIFREVVVEILGNHLSQDGISKKFQTLIAGMLGVLGGRMGDRLDDPHGILEGILESLLDLRHEGGV